MKMFKGLTNEPETAFHHIAVLLEAGGDAANLLI